MGIGGRVLNGLSLRVMSAVLVLVGSSACGGSVMLETDADAYEAGEPVELILRNYGAVAVGYNLCLSSLERQEGTDFQRVEVMPSDAACPADMKGLLLGQKATFRFNETAELSEGSYRFSTRIEVRGRDERISTEMFEIRLE